MSNLLIKDVQCEYHYNPIGLDYKAPRFSWVLENSTQRSVLQCAYQIQVAFNKDFTTLVWDSGKTYSDQSIHVSYQGSPLLPQTRYYYRITIWDNYNNQSDWSETCFWETGLMQSSKWIASWITPAWNEDSNKSQPCPFMRKEFSLPSPISQARIYVTSLGLYELRLNGKRIGDYLFTPGWTSYNRRIQYQTYDVTSLLKPGNNAIGAILGDGWYRGYLGWKDNRNLYGDKIALLCQMHIVCTDGSEYIIGSDQNWKASTGPILQSDIYNGEIYDATQELGDWDLPGYGDTTWSTVELLDKPTAIVRAQESVPVRQTGEVRPLALLQTPAGDWVLDMGQNMVGWMRCNFQGERGTEISLYHAEVLDGEGNFYTDNLRTADQKITYTLKGTDKETYQPHFSFQGFRYVKIEGFTQPICLDDFTGIVIHSDMTPVGTFACSNDLVNQLQKNIVWGQRGNFLDVPTDCPQRDERLGWTGDAQAFISTACFNMDSTTFFTKWLRDLAVDQKSDGAVPHVIPDVLGRNSKASAAWGDAATICPWTIYLYYGDTQVLAEQYPSMKAWVEYIRTQGSNEYLWNTGTHFGDWLALDAKENSYKGATDNDLIATAFYAYSTQLLQRTALLLGKADDATYYQELYEKVVQQFQQEFVTPNGRLTVPTQTAHVLALMFELLDPKDRKRAIETLVGYIKEQKYHLATGFVGTPYLCFVLSDYGYADVAYTLLQQTDYPSWLYPITKGATTIWEHWDGIKVDGSFWPKAMNSFNHYAYGAIGDWMYRRMCGIDLDWQNPGFKHIVIRPEINSDFSYAHASHNSMYGEIRSGWELTASQITLDITIPANTTATVVLRNMKQDEILEGGKPLAEASGVLEVQSTEHGLAVKIGSGSYRFVK